MMYVALNIINGVVVVNQNLPWCEENTYSIVWFQIVIDKQNDIKCNI